MECEQFLFLFRLNWITTLSKETFLQLECRVFMLRFTIPETWPNMQYP